MTFSTLNCYTTTHHIVLGTGSIRILTRLYPGINHYVSACRGITDV